VVFSSILLVWPFLPHSTSLFKSSQFSKPLGRSLWSEVRSNCAETDYLKLVAARSSVAPIFRAPSGPYLGYCIPCQCNGHSDECDVVTGKCFNCKHNTHGDHCEICNSGYYGNSTVGDPHDCLICPCPRPDVSNNLKVARSASALA